MKQSKTRAGAKDSRPRRSNQQSTSTRRAPRVHRAATPEANIEKEEPAAPPWDECVFDPKASVPEAIVARLKTIRTFRRMEFLKSGPNLKAFIHLEMARSGVCGLLVGPNGPCPRIRWVESRKKQLKRAAHWWAAKTAAAVNRFGMGFRALAAKATAIEGVSPDDYTVVDVLLFRSFQDMIPLEREALILLRAYTMAMAQSGECGAYDWEACKAAAEKVLVVELAPPKARAKR